MTPTELTVNAGHITARVAKAGAGDPLVYLHGAFGYQGWPAFLDRLSERFTVYAPVHPGFGETDGVEGLDDILDLTLYHVDLLDALELERPHLVGHFFGAMAAAETAALHPPPGGQAGAGLARRPVAGGRSRRRLLRYAGGRAAGPAFR